MSWTIFIKPFTYLLWIFIMLLGIFYAIILTLTNSRKNFLKTLVSNIWDIFKTTFGYGKLQQRKDSLAVQILITSILTSGMMLWIFYRSYLTAAFFLEKQTIPFNSPETLLDSDYKYVIFKKMYNLIMQRHIWGFVTNAKKYFPVKPWYCHSDLVHCQSSWICSKSGCQLRQFL